MKARDSYGHRWNGWPGAMCFYCHSEDPREICLADEDLYFDPKADNYLECPEHPMVQCPASDEEKDRVDVNLDKPLESHHLYGMIK